MTALAVERESIHAAATADLAIVVAATIVESALSDAAVAQLSDVNNGFGGLTLRTQL